MADSTPVELLAQRKKLLELYAKQRAALEKLDFDKLLHPEQQKFANDPAQFQVGRAHV